MIIYVLRGQDSQTQIGLSAAVGVETYYAMGQTSEESTKTKHVDIGPTTNCFDQDVQHSGHTYACVM